jgi:spore coat polysaccharide biosynthesis protein SpsF
MNQKANNLELSPVWSGEFGDEYTERQIDTVASNMHLFRQVFGDYKLESVIEYGAGSGMNLEALHKLMPQCNLTGVEINAVACKAMREKPYITVLETSALYCSKTALIMRKRELALTKGFLIHVPPDDLPTMYREIYNGSNHYILLCEYYNPKPVEITYRGYDGLLWKRDFAGEMLDMFSDLELVKYGFVYHRDEHPLDDITWFLLRK